MIDYLWWVVYKDLYPATDTGLAYRDAAIDYISKIDDISRVAYDGRIQEGVIVIPEINEKFALFLLLPPIMVFSNLLRKKSLSS